MMAPRTDVSRDRSDRYRQLSERFGRDTVLPLIDRLQVLALTQPDALREMEEFLDKDTKDTKDTNNKNALCP
jgi:hypothetical protein